MKFGWDDTKRFANVRKHGIDFADCPPVFAGYTVTMEDDRFPYGERRFLTVGMLGQHVVAISHTETSDTIRIISARKATRREHDIFFSQVSH